MVIIPGKNKNLSIRYYANVIDYLILTILIGAYFFSVGTEEENGTYLVTGLKTLVIPLIWVIYFPTCEAITGQTLGKKAFKLFIVDMKGETPTIIQTFLRRMLDVVEIMLLGIPALLIINHSRKNQRLGDMLAGTTVINTDSICRFCGVYLELTPKEVVNDHFTCPNCKEIN